MGTCVNVEGFLRVGGLLSVEVCLKVEDCLQQATNRSSITKVAVRAPPPTFELLFGLRQCKTVNDTARRDRYILASSDGIAHRR